MSDSEVNDDLLQLSAKELERRRRKNKKKKMSKKLNRANNANAEAEEAIVTEYMEKQAAEAASNAAAKKAAFDSEAVTVENDAPVEDKGTEESAIDCSTVEQKDVVAEKSASSEADAAAESVAVDDDVFVEIDYVSETPELDKNDPNYAYFSKVFNAFKIKTEDEIKKEATTKYIKEDVVEDSFNKAAISEQILQEEINQRRKEAEEAGEAQKLSRRKLRLSMQPSIADLKESTPRPDVVEWADVTSRDPYLLVELKAYRNTVMVPRHWNAKRKYLAGKRGFERPPFELPDFIKRTGIMEMRETMWEKEDSQSLKSKMRERTRPKMGRIDIDYQKLHDAFFKWQTKPPMTRMGELYYEGKELEAQMKEKKPGQLSDELRIALGMPVGPTAGKFPPPWLIAMQRYGPPPSYPNLKIPGLNAPIPEGCSFGYHAGGWGKPPVDEYGKPLYGDVFGIEAPHTNEIEDESRIERRHWGEIGSDEEDSDEESDVEEDEGPAVQPPESGFVTPATTEGFATPSGITTIPGVETPDSIELRKRKTESVAGGDTPQALYRVLEEKRVDRLGGQIMGSSHVYDLSQSKLVVPNDGVEVSLNPEELDMTDQRGLERKYEEQLRKQNRVRIDNQEDLSDMVAEQNAKLNRKRRATDQKKNAPQSGGGGTNSSQKKYKDFKF